MASSYLHSTSFLGDLSQATQEYVDKRIHSQVTTKDPMLLSMLMRGSIVKKACIAYKVKTDTAEITPLMQTYDMADGLTSGKTDTLNDAVFTIRYAQLPIEVSEEEELASEQGSPGTVLVNLAALRGKKALRGIRLGIMRMILGGSLTSNAASASSDSRATNKSFQSLVQALTHDLAYGHLTRTIGSSTNTHWQGGSISGAYTDVGTARVASIATVRSAIDAVQDLWDSPSDGALFVGPALFRKIQSEVEAAGIKPEKGPLFKYGFTSIMIDGLEIVNDWFLKTVYRTGAPSMAFLLNLKNCRLWFHPSRFFKVTKFTDQDTQEDGLPKKLARVKIGGNFFVTVPGSCVYNTAWS